jgi:hypothetical protein
MPFDVQEESVGPTEVVLYNPAHPRRIDSRGLTNGGMDVESAHAVTVQVAGCQWIEGVPADSLGKASFRLNAITGVDENLDSSKTCLEAQGPHVSTPQPKDWREDNMMQLVCETVRSSNGGREVTLRSCFRLRNSTGHHLLVAKYQDPRHSQNASRSGDIFTRFRFALTVPRSRL